MLVCSATLILSGCALFGSGSDGDSRAEEFGVSPRGIAVAVERARATGTVHSLLVERHGEVVTEEYFGGYHRETLHPAWSVTKSVTSTLIGIAIDRGLIGGVDRPIGELLSGVVPDLADEKSRITVRHLLTMSCGIPWIEGGLSSEYPQWMAALNQVDYFVDKPLEHVPGEYFDYSDGGAHLAGVVLQEAVGRPSLEFAQEYLFGPLEFGAVTWGTDNQGYNLGGVGLGIRPVDMVRLGRLFLNGGWWGGLQIVSSSWIETATASQISWDRENPDPSRGYGFFWWVTECNGQPCYHASGYGGQLIVVVPHLDLVVVTTGDWEGGRADANASWDTAFDLVMESVLPSVR